MAQVPQTPAASRDKIEYKPTVDEAELIRLSHLWMEIAQRQRDESALQALRLIMAPDFNLQVWDARRATVPLDAWLQRGMAVNSQFGYEGMNAQVIGGIGVVYSRFWWSGILDGTAFFDQGFLVDLWRRTSKSWQVFSRRSAPIEQISQLRQPPA